MTHRHRLLGHDVHPLAVTAAFLVLAGAALLAAGMGGSWWLLTVGIIAPDLTFLAAAGQQPSAPGLMPPRAVPFYNAAHHPLLPAAAAAAALTTGWAAGAVLATAWLSHIVWDRGVGYTRRDKNGHQQPSRW